MSMQLALRAVSESQAQSLRSGGTTADDLVTLARASYAGEGDVTHVGAGCLFTMFAAVIAVSLRNLLGSSGALVAFGVFEAAAVWIAWELYRGTHPRRSLQSIDPELLIPDEACLWLTYWQGIHYLLTGTPWEGEFPQDFLLHGGTELRLLEYGPERLLTPDAVTESWNALSSIDETELLSRYDAEEMNRLKVHPCRWHDEAERVGLAREFAALRQFMQRAADKGHFLVAALV
jgi:hypothetical protein